MCARLCPYLAPAETGRTHPKSQGCIFLALAEMRYCVLGFFSQIRLALSFQQLRLILRRRACTWIEGSPLDDESVFGLLDGMIGCPEERLGIFASSHDGLIRLIGLPQCIVCDLFLPVDFLDQISPLSV